MLNPLDQSFFSLSIYILIFFMKFLIPSLILHYLVYIPNILRSKFESMRGMKFFSFQVKFPNKLKSDK